MRRARTLWLLATILAGALTLVAAFAALTGATHVALGVLALLVGEATCVALGAVGLLVRLDARVRKQALTARDSRKAMSRVLERLGGLRSLVRQRTGRIQRAVDGDAESGYGARLSAIERRYLEAFEAERLRAADRHREALVALERIDEEVASISTRLVQASGADRLVTSAALDKVAHRLTNVIRDETSEIEALLQVLPRLSTSTLLPPSGQWAMNARSLGHLLDVAEAHRPRTVLELGGGTSTIWLGHALAGTGARIVSIDHDERYAERTRRQIELHRLHDVVEVRVAPLRQVDVNGEPRTWYDPAVFADVRGVDLLVIDGPPKRTGDLARWPALPLLASQLDERAVVVLDDADRPDEVEAVRRWMEALPGLRQSDEGVSRLAVLRRD